MPLGRKDDLSFNKDNDSLTLEQAYFYRGIKFQPKNKTNPNWRSDDPFEGSPPARPGKKKK